jgi:aromatic ring-opening dioxygenase catalytic subunit (LigB family)
MTQLKALELVAIAILAQRNLLSQFFLGQRITTMLGRKGQIIAIPNGAPTHYFVQFQDGSAFWCRPGQFLSSYSVYQFWVDHDTSLWPTDADES